MPLRTVSSAMPYWLSAVGFSSTRTPGSELPPTMTWPTPGSWDSFCCRMLEAASYICPRLSVSDVSETISGSLVGGGATGFTLGPDGGLVPQPTEIDGAVLQTLVSDAGNCLCKLPCAEHYTLTGTLNR